MMRKLAMLAVVTVATSGCSPKAKPYGMAVGAITTVVGGLVYADGSLDKCEQDVVGGLVCLPAQMSKSMLGATLIGVGGLLFIIAAVSPGEPKPDVDPVRPAPTVPAANGDPLVRARPVVRLGFD